MAADGTDVSYREHAITIAGHDVVDLIGSASFTTTLLLALDGSLPDAGRVRVVDGVLVAIMDHGITPSSLVTRTVLDGAPESATTAIAAGLLAIGSRFLGTIADAANLLQRIVAATPASDPRSAMTAEVERYHSAGRKIPGLGHNLHSTSDPRVARLLDLAKEEQQNGAHIDAFDALPEIAATVTGRKLIANAAGAVGAVLSDLGYPADLIGGFATVARSGGLFAHVAEERRAPIARSVWQRAHDDHASGR
jgi:citrate synthase